MNKKEKIKCDVCGQKNALYDARTSLECWAYLCQEDFEKYGVGLGLGKGQLLNETQNKEKINETRR